MKKPINSKTEKTTASKRSTGTGNSKRDYEKYLRTKWFKGVRQTVLERDHYRCQTCGATSQERVLNVHHTQYIGVIGNEYDHLDKMITLCSVCHRAIHSAKANYKRFQSAGVDFLTVLAEKNSPST